jgi:hypothetical protein
MDKETAISIRVGAWWALGLGSMLALVAGIGTIQRPAIVFLVIVGSVGFNLAAWEHGWFAKPRGFLVFLLVCGAMGFLGYKVWPLPETTKIVPVVLWFPASIKAGEPITAAQLNAVVTVDGIQIDGDAIYNPALGSTLHAGTDTLSLTFTPSNASYSQVTKTVVVHVFESLHPKPMLNSSNLLNIIPARPSGGREPGNVVSLVLNIKNNANHPIDQETMALYWIGIHKDSAKEEAEFEENLWQKMIADTKEKWPSVVPSGPLGVGFKLETTPLSPLASAKLKDGTFVVFFMSEIRDPKTKRTLAQFCGVILKDNTIEACRSHNAP